MAYFYNEIIVGQNYTDKMDRPFTVLEEIEEGVKRKSFKIKYLNTGTEKIYAEIILKSKESIDYNSPTIFNVGILGEEFYQLNFNNRISNYRDYKAWNGILSRCYNKESKDYRFYGEKGITICEEWKYFKNFKDWWKEQNYEEGLELDKDIICLAENREFKQYSPYTCLLIPARLNQFFITYKNKNSNIEKTAHGFCAFVHFGDKLIRGTRNVSFEQAEKEKKEIKKQCFLELHKELHFSEKIYNYCMKIFEDI